MILGLTFKFNTKLNSYVIKNYSFTKTNQFFDSLLKHFLSYLKLVVFINDLFIIHLTKVLITRKSMPDFSGNLLFAINPDNQTDLFDQS